MDYYNNQPKSHKTSVASVRPRRQHDVHQSHAKSPDMGTSPVLAQGHDGSPDVYYGINDGPDDNTNLPGGATTATLWCVATAHGVFSQPTTTMRILSFGGFDGCTQGGADAAKWLKST
jgi:hypothetical protein